MPRVPVLVSRAALLAALGLLALVLASISGKPPLGTDSLIYHLAVPAAWLKAGWLARMDLPFHDGAAEHAPALAETLEFLLMKLVRDDGLAWIVQPVFFFAMLRWFYLTARFAGAGEAAALAGTALVAAHAPFVASLQLANCDLVETAGAAWFLFGLVRAPRFPRAAAVSAAGGIGLMLAAKAIGVVYAASAVMAFAPFVVRVRKGTDRLPRFELGAALTVLAFAALFYGRNLVLHGNPLWPQKLPGLPGLYDLSRIADHGWSPVALGRMLVNSDDLFGMTLAASIPLWAGWIALVAVAVRKRSKLFAELAAFPLLAIVLYFARVPFWKEHRLLFPAVYALAVCGVAALTRLRSPAVRPWIGPALVFLLFARLGIGGAFALPTTWAVVVAGAVATALPWKRRIVTKRTLAAAAGVLGVVVVTAPLWHSPFDDEERARHYAEAYDAEGEAWAAIHREKGPQAVAYAGTPRILPLFGPSLANDVFYAPVGTEDRPGPVELHRGDSIYLRLAQARRAKTDVTFWLEALRSRHATLLLLDDDSAVGGTAFELDTVAHHPEMFQLVFAKDRVALFRVR